MKHRSLKAGILAMLLSAGFLTGTAAAAAPAGDGDVNCNQSTDIADAVLLARFLAEDAEADITAQGKLNADMNGDGDVTSADLTRLLEELANITHTGSYGTVNLLGGYTLGCGKATALDDDFRAAQLNFSAELFRAADSGNKAYNVLISPVSVAIALGMTANGANGQTRSEMEQVLGSGLTVEQLNGYYQAWTADLMSAQDARVSLANSIWVRDDETCIKVPERFLQTVADHYDAGAFKAPFDETTRLDINSWISGRTNGMIPDMLKKINPDEIMYLINALCLENDWAEQYEEYQVRDSFFCPEKNRMNAVEMMHSIELGWIDDGMAQGAVKTLKGGKFRYIVVMPNEDIALSDYIASLDGEKLSGLIGGIKPEPVLLEMPKYKLECEADLEKVLPMLGMKTAFIPDADFTGLNSVGNNTFIGAVQHNTALEVNETGIRAAAATIVKMTRGAAMQDFHELTVDRPFLVMIVDAENDLPVFIGAVREIGEEMPVPVPGN